MEENKILECTNLRKIIGRKEILKNVSLEINQGDILGFIGPNGAGKTTTIKLILGLQKITSGTVKMIANLYEEITKERIEEVVKLVGLENRIKDKVSKYSLGMRQRLGIAQAILHKPNLLILDEPTNGLDPEGIKQVKDLLTKLAKEEKMAILISSHNLLELESFCNKITIIKNGEIVESTTIEEAKKVNQTEGYIFETANSEKAMQSITKKARRINETEIEALIPKKEIPEVIDELVKRNVKIYGIYPRENNLEEAFLKKIGGNVID